MYQILEVQEDYLKSFFVQRGMLGNRRVKKVSKKHTHTVCIHSVCLLVGPFRIGTVSIEPNTLSVFG